MELVRSSFFAQSESLKNARQFDWLGVTIGNFDGMHVGHQALFRALQEGEPQQQRTAKVLLSFTPHPRVFFSGLTKSEVGANQKFHRINTFRERYLLAKKYDFDAFVLARFSNAVAQSSPRDFVKRYLVAGLGADLVVVGDDWRFGKGREGDSAMLQELGDEFGFAVRVVGEQVAGDQRVSTSRVKQALSQGDLPAVSKLLGRNYSLVGRVVKGQQRGRTIGFPTANICPREKVLPKFGVYAVWAETAVGTFAAVTNVGVRPTVGGGEPNIETHIFAEQPLELYGSYLKLEFVTRLRDEQKFESLQALQDQIAVDCQQAKRVLL